MKPLCYYIFSLLRLIKIRKYIPPCQRLLDICCGEEYYLLKSIRHIIKELHGIDLKVKDGFNGNIFLRKLSVTNKLKYPANFFDVVVLSAALEHLENPKKILKEVYRILKYNGKVIITTPTPKARYILSLLRAFYLSEIKDNDHKHLFTRRELRKILEEVGFKNIKVYGFEFGLNTLALGVKK